MAFPTKDAELAAYSTNWDTRITATPTVFALSAAQATAYTTVHVAYIAAYEAAAAVGARSKSLVAAKNTAKANLLRLGRELYAIVQASLTVSDANKELLGVTVKDNLPTPTPPPTVVPDMDVVSITANVVRVRIHDSATTLRRKPAGVLGANVYSYVGATPPSDVNAWKFEGGTTRTTTDVAFDASLAPGTKVWLTACWFNRRALTGPACTPIGALIQFGGELPMAA